jgi:hypothetical protein
VLVDGPACRGVEWVEVLVDGPLLRSIRLTRSFKVLTRLSALRVD